MRAAHTHLEKVKVSGGGGVCQTGSKKDVHTFPESEGKTSNRSAKCCRKRCCLLCAEGE